MIFPFYFNNIYTINQSNYLISGIYWCIHIIIELWSLQSFLGLPHDVLFRCFRIPLLLWESNQEFQPPLFLLVLFFILSLGLSYHAFYINFISLLNYEILRAMIEQNYAYLSSIILVNYTSSNIDWVFPSKAWSWSDPSVSIMWNHPTEASRNLSFSMCRNDNVLWAAQIITSSTITSFFW